MTRFGVAALSAAALLAGCSDDNKTGPGPTAEVRVVHASPDAPAVNVLVDDKAVLSNVAYKQSSNYLSVAAGTRNIKVNAAAGGATVINADASVTEGSSYTVIATGLLANIEPLVLIDDRTAPAAGNIKLRLVHGAPNVAEVDIYITAPGADIDAATPALTDVPFQGASAFLEVPAGDYQVRVTPANSKTVALDTGALTLTAGQVRTAIAVEAPGGGTPLGALLLADLN
ncbi:MAG TPA: DUF4397 domain-containing protein [Gemmatimonadales bacterium]|nr:DUF4397 domain-containing protein [Gemmatimonadales bacterium]